MPYTVLVVDDDTIINETLAEVLGLEGFATLTAENGQRALDLIARRPPDLILLDMQLPDLTGWDVAHELQVLGMDIPIVVMTAAPSAFAWAKQMHAIDYLMKPFDLDDMLAVVNRVCSTRP